MSVSAVVADETRSRAVRGLAWKAFSNVSVQASRMVTAVLLARMLRPFDYGLAGMVLVIATLVYVFADLGMGAALVQRRDISDVDKSTVFWFTLAVGAALTGIGVAVSPLVADFYREPKVAPLFAAFSFCFVLSSLSATQSALLTREMDFRALELRQIISYLAGAVVGIGLAAAGYGAWAIIGQQLAIAFVASLVLVVMTPWRPSFAFSRESLRRLGSFGGRVFGARMLFYANRNTDNVLVGRFIGASALGAYSVAYNVMLMPFNQIAAPIQEVLLPAFARFQDEPRRIADIWLRANRLVAAVSVPALLGMMIVAPEFVHVVLGEKWKAAVPVIRVLSWVGLLQSVQRSNGNILQARERPGLMFRYSIVALVASLVAFVGGLPWGIVGVATAYAISSTIVEPYYMWLTVRTLGVSMREVGASLRGVAEASALMGVVVLAAAAGVRGTSLSPSLRLVILVAVGAAAYAAACRWRAPVVVEQVRHVVAQRRAARAASPFVG
jgi:O-antigen/teichoic acid export membrane protein